MGCCSHLAQSAAVQFRARAQAQRCPVQPLHGMKIPRCEAPPAWSGQVERLEAPFPSQTTRVPASRWRREQNLRR